MGVNQRDLVTFQVDHARALRMAGVIPVDVVRVAESGFGGADDAHRLRAAGYHAMLVGETLVTSPDPAAAIRELRGSGRARQLTDPTGDPGVERGPWRGEIHARDRRANLVAWTRVRQDLRDHQRGRCAAVRRHRAPTRSASSSRRRARQIAVQQAYDIARRLPPEVMTVGVFRDELPSPGRSRRSTEPACGPPSCTVTRRLPRWPKSPSRCGG